MKTYIPAVGCALLLISGAAAVRADPDQIKAQLPVVFIEDINSLTQTNAIHGNSWLVYPAPSTIAYAPAPSTNLILAPDATAGGAPATSTNAPVAPLPPPPSPDSTPNNLQGAPTLQGTTSGSGPI